MTELGGNVVVVEQLSREYPVPRGAGPVAALQDVSFTVRSGERLAVLGERGSGKTTLVNLLAGLDRPTHGGVVVYGRDLTRLGETALARHRARRIGLVLPEFPFLPSLTAADNVALPMEALLSTPSARRDRARALLDTAGLGERAEERPDRWATGELRRLAVARAFANRPALVLADEPTEGMDEGSRAPVLDLLARLCSESRTSLVVTTADPAAASRCSRRLVLHRGRIVAERDRAERFAPSSEPAVGASDPGRALA